MKRLIFILMACALLLSGCSQEELAAQIFPAEKVSENTVTIVDGQMKTVVHVGLGRSVAQVLEAAEISVDENCQITPALDEGAGDEIRIGRPMTVSLYVDDKKSEITVYSGKVKDVLDQAPRAITEQDLVNEDEDVYVHDGMEIRVVHKNEITIEHDGKTETVFSSAKTVKDALAEQNLTLGADDRIEPELTKKVVEGTKIVIKRVTFQEETATVEIPFETTTKENASEAEGTKKTLQEGVNGSKDVVYKITLVDGVEESREEISSTVTKEPVNKIVEKGTKKKVGKHLVKKVKQWVDCDGTVAWKYYYSDGSTKMVYKKPKN